MADIRGCPVNPTASPACRAPARRSVPLHPGTPCSVRDQSVEDDTAPGRGTGGDLRTDRPLLSRLPGQPGVRPQPGLRQRQRAARGAERLLRTLGRHPGRAAHRLRARAPHPPHRTLRTRQLAASAGQHALPVRLRGDGRGTHGPGAFRRSSTSPRAISRCSCTPWRTRPPTRPWSEPPARSPPCSAPSSASSPAPGSPACFPFLFFLPLRFPAWIVLIFWFVLQWLAARTAGAGPRRRLSRACAGLLHGLPLRGGTLLAYR